MIVGMVPIESLTDEDALLRATLPEVDDASTGQLRAFFQTLAYAAAHGHSVSLSA